VAHSKSQTIWTAITDYDYNSLSIFSAGTFENKFINNLIIRFKIPNFFHNNIKAYLGDVFSWDSNLIHKGNLNSSGQIAIALQMQKFDFLSSSDVLKIYNYEEAFPKMLDLSINNYSISVFFKNYLFLIENLKKIILKNLSLKQSLLDLERFLENEFKEKNKIISFALSVLAQRLQSLKNKRLNSPLLFTCSARDSSLKIDNFCLFLDLSSIFLGSNNPLSNKRVLNNINFNNDLFPIIKKFDRKKND
jgi:hypothetical protein